MLDNRTRMPTRQPALLLLLLLLDQLASRTTPQYLKPQQALQSRPSQTIPGLFS